MAATAVTLRLRNETKGAVRYEEPEYRDDPMYLIGTLYLRKAGLMHHFTIDTGEWPQEIKISIEA